MISAICLIYLGVKCGAPLWYYILISAGLAIKLINFGCELYKAGAKSKR